MTYRVVVTIRANADAIQVVRRKRETSVRSAERWYAGLEKAIAKLNKFPERHPIAEEESDWAGIPLRQMIYGKKPATYRILFSISGDAVVLHQIRHSARDSIHNDEK